MPQKTNQPTFQRGHVLKSRVTCTNGTTEPILYIFLSFDKTTGRVKTIPFIPHKGAEEKIWDSRMPLFFEVADEKFQLEYLYPWQHFNIELYVDLLEKRAMQKLSKVH